ncbi:hypothetical protein SAMN03159496_01203 [Rhizobium sp. NFR07]|uniref:hypothetical protein n=1 Tax=Rhizobium sp. NFR07 TaxID=1566262 RepID=UPI0008F39D6F|nr:hypothetical protein [Rhizobium sp. NFR07]SFA96279.1 hypothetical protein SAMN03159496_01203 [Rhizobium sp. NFR07]
MSSVLRNGRLWRVAYLAEIAVLAVPTLTPIGLLAIVGTLYCGGATLIGLDMLPGYMAGRYGDASGTVDLVVLGSAGTLICVSALCAISRFIRLSRAYVFGSARALLNHVEDFRIGLTLALALLIFNGSLAAIMPGEGQALFLLLFFANAVILIPVTHLWIAMRQARRSTNEVGPDKQAPIVGAR